MDPADCHDCPERLNEWGEQRPELPSSWRELSRSGLFRCSTCGAAWSLREDRRECAWIGERLDERAEPFLAGRAGIDELLEIAGSSGWLRGEALRWVCEEDFDFGELARRLLERMEGAELGDASRLLALARNAASGVSGRRLWKDIQRGRAKPLRIDQGPVLRDSERDQPMPRFYVDEVERWAQSVIGTEFGRAVDLVEPSEEQREALLDFAGAARDLPGGGPETPGQVIVTRAPRPSRRPRPQLRRRPKPATARLPPEPRLEALPVRELKWGQLLGLFVGAYPWMLPGIALLVVGVEWLTPAAWGPTPWPARAPVWFLFASPLVVGALRGTELTDAGFFRLFRRGSGLFASIGLMACFGTFAWILVASFVGWLLAGWLLPGTAEPDESSRAITLALVVAAAPWTWLLARWWPSFFVPYFDAHPRGTSADPTGGRRDLTGAWRLTARRGAFVRATLPVGLMALLLLGGGVAAYEGLSGSGRLLSGAFLHLLAAPFLLVLAIDRTAALLGWVRTRALLET